MTTAFFTTSPRLPLLVALAVAFSGLAGGCGSPEAGFHMNMVYLTKREKDALTDKAPHLPGQQRQDLADSLFALFGTPADPYLPPPGDAGLGEVLDLDKLRMAAGAVGRDDLGRPRGLYRQHCAHCHGVTGDGAGPTAAFLNPYPRDYRRGIFKFKSTPKGVRPTHDDLKRILVQGIPGTAMPSFRLLAEDELESLVHYVKYLAIRGEVERALIDDSIELDFENGERLVASRAYLAEEKLARVVARWREAAAEVTEIAARPDWSESERAAAVDRGRELFYGKIANCFSCHGDTALGDGTNDDFDDWWKELQPKERPEWIDDFVAMGALPPRNAVPRNLRVGVFRGGRRPIDVFWRIRNGIDGSPMPAAAFNPPGAPPDPKKLSTEDVWCLVEYVHQLPYESINNPRQSVPAYQRERN